MAVRTATGRAWNDGHLASMSEAAVELVTITRSHHACWLCTRWEGRVLALSGPAGEHQVEHTLTDETVTVDAAATATGEQARLEGLMHPNCRHQFVPYLPGVTKLDEIREHDAKAEQDREDLRALERKVRRNKRKAAAALTDDERQAAERRVRETQAEIRKHVKRTGLNRKRYREQIIADVTPAAAGPVTIRHGLGNQFVDVSVYDISVTTPALVLTGVDLTDADNVALSFGGAGAYRVVVVG
jgi:hypothetical protein